MHFLITGGAGFIGSHIVERLLEEGQQVTVVDDLSSGRRDNLPVSSSLRFIHNSIENLDFREIGEKIDGIAHLAAIPSVGRSWAEPWEAHTANLSATVRVIEWCQRLAVSRFVFASSAAVYGKPDDLPISEKHPTIPLSPYGLQKLASEGYGRMFSAKSKFSFVALRLFNVYGPRQNSASAYSGVISKFASAIEEGRPVTIYGDGEQTRDFVYVEDVARAFVQALTVRNLKDALICNIGTGVAVSLKELLTQLCERYSTRRPKVVFETAQLGDIPHSCADISHASAALNFGPAYTIARGLEEKRNAESREEFVPNHSAAPIRLTTPASRTGCGDS